MTGLSNEDVDAMDYMDDDDPRKMQYQTARKYAEVAVMQQIYAAQQEQQRKPLSSCVICCLSIHFHVVCSHLIHSPCFFYDCVRVRKSASRKSSIHHLRTKIHRQVFQNDLK